VPSRKKAGPNLTLHQVFCDFWLAYEFSADSKKSDYPNDKKEHERNCGCLANTAFICPT
jgi:hypothetical protein